MLSMEKNLKLLQNKIYCSIITIENPKEKVKKRGTKHEKR